MTESVREEKPVLLIINVSLIVVIVIAAMLYAGLFTDLGVDDSMRFAVLAGVFLVCDVAFFAMGVALIFMSRKRKVTWINMLIPFLAIPAFSILPVKEIYEPFTGPITDIQIGLAGLLVALFLIGLVIMEIIRFRRDELR